MNYTSKVRTCLWFNGQGEEAAEFYTSLLPGSHIESRSYPEPGKPALVVEFTLAGAPYMTLGLMGGGMQPQGHTQIILNLVDFGMGLQEAGDAARWEHTGGCEPTDDYSGDACEEDMGVVHLESGIPPETRAELERRGYTVECCSANGGGYQAIMKDFESGAWIAATEMRKDGVAGGF